MIAWDAAQGRWSSPPLIPCRDDHLTSLHQYTTIRFDSFTTLLPITMPASNVQWFCSKCKKRLYKKRGEHEGCGGRLTYFCVGSKRRGDHKVFARHARHCEHCTPALTNTLHRERERNKENRRTEVEVDEQGISRATPSFIHTNAPPSF